MLQHSFTRQLLAAMVIMAGAFLATTMHATQATSTDANHAIPTNQRHILVLASIMPLSLNSWPGCTADQQPTVQMVAWEAMTTTTIASTNHQTLD